MCHVPRCHAARAARTYPQTKDVEHGAQYRQLLISTIHHCAVNFMSVAGSVIHMLMDFLGDSSTASALEVVYFVREIAEASSQLRATVMRRMMDTFRQTHSGRVCACALWIMSEYASSVQEVKGALETIRTSLGDLPLVRGNGSFALDPQVGLWTRVDVLICPPAPCRPRRARKTW